MGNFGIATEAQPYFNGRDTTLLKQNGAESPVVMNAVEPLPFWEQQRILNGMVEIDTTSIDAA
jgi:hypothetical protein